MTTTTIVIDDQPDIRFLISQMIELSDDTLQVVAEAGTGEDAVRLIKAMDSDDIPEVVVTDWMMPGMNGLETVAQIRQQRPNARFIMCSAFADDSLEAEAREAGVDRFLSKDRIDQIPAAIRELGQPG
ncbi:response regulator transcription factor [Euzebya tangerina]|uniref:response regulator transcription factor n=1 Tax=Euzebya tangerina TaxID=591198 RepID=UPI000E31A824|nr:response regulator transcription factor [Euzebya tangerina]